MFLPVNYWPFEFSYKSDLNNTKGNKFHEKGMMEEWQILEYYL